MRAENWRTFLLVRGALGRTRGLAVSDIRVIAKAGEVSLSGTVPDTSQIALAGAAAAEAPSVKTVNNQLTVRIPGGH
jgi:hyperosmotically inducible periplasmic protein